uniref:Uncharacterized protein n=1 Tax=Arundo donax TaxID=35708 RepID=A0A0A8YJ01_ARUDO
MHRKLISFLHTRPKSKMVGVHHQQSGTYSS